MIECKLQKKTESQSAMFMDYIHAYSLLADFPASMKEHFNMIIHFFDEKHVYAHSDPQLLTGFLFAYQSLLFSYSFRAAILTTVLFCPITLWNITTCILKPCPILLEHYTSYIQTELIVATFQL